MKAAISRRAARGAAAAALLLAALAPATGRAATGEELYKTKTCIACHGPDAKTPILPSYPKLAGQNAEYLLQQAKDIQSGARDNANTAAMKGVMHLVNDEELKLIADWLAALP
ncbi:MAG: cytochrome C [Proteobacteria bacterium]|nr:MAG: cytochrome C [Pseudomonadota bacterium]